LNAGNINVIYFPGGSNTDGNSTCKHSENY
jgi:hypothetical protein